MGSSGFGFPTSGNNAPLPIPGNTNPTGTNSGVGFGGVSFPNYPMFGAPSSSPVSPSANAPIFGVGGMSGLSSGFGSLPGGQQYGSQIYNDLGKMYGKGPGQLLGNILEQGLFNPQVASAFLNAMQPSINQGAASVSNAFGAEGSRFGSAEALGLGNYMSQVNLNEQQTLASMYQNAQQEQLQLLEGVLPGLHAEQANKGGWVHDLLGGLEIAGGLLAAPMTGGMSLGLTAAGVNTITGSGGGGGGGGTSGFGMPTTGMPNFNTGTFGNNAPKVGSQAWYDNWYAGEQSASAGAALGGSGAPMMIPGMNIPFSS